MSIFFYYMSTFFILCPIFLIFVHNSNIMSTFLINCPPFFVFAHFLNIKSTLTLNNWPYYNLSIEILLQRRRRIQKLFSTQLPGSTYMQSLWRVFYPELKIAPSASLRLLSLCSLLGSTTMDRPTLQNIVSEWVEKVMRV